MALAERQPARLTVITDDGVQVSEEWVFVVPTRGGGMTIAWLPESAVDLGESFILELASGSTIEGIRNP